MARIDELVDHVARLTYQDLPETVVESVKKSVLDTLGAAVAGSSADSCRKLVKLINLWGGKGESTLISYGSKSPATLAALANSTMARARELDDVHEAAGMHLSATIVPSAFVIAEYSKTSRGKLIDGKSFILANALGSDLNCRLRMAERIGGENIGWNGETSAPIAVAAMSAKMLGFNKSEILNAMGIAYAQCATNTQAYVDGAMTASLQQGLAAQAGILSTMLAGEGITGARDILEGVYGYYSLYMRGEFAPEKLMSKLGEDYAIANVTTKLYPCCLGTHSAISGALQLTKEHSIKVDDIQETKISTSSLFYKFLGGKEKIRPQSVVDAQFSYYFTVASALVKGELAIDDFTEKGIKNPQVLDVARRIRVVADFRKDKLGTQVAPVDVEIITKDGRHFGKTVEFSKGHPKNPLSMEEYIDKFDNCIRFSAKPLSSNSIKRFKQKVEELDKLDDVTTIIDCLR